MANVDGKIILGLDINATSANIQSGIDKILNNTKTRKIILETTIEKAEAEKSIETLVKNINKKTIGMGIKVNAEDVQKILAEQQKIASKQAELNRQMQEYRSIAKSIGVTLNKDTWNAFNHAIKVGDFVKAKDIIKSAKQQIEEYHKSVAKMNSDISIAGSVSSIVNQFNKLKDVSTETQKRINLLKANLAQFENADNTQNKLSAYKRLQTMVGILSDELRNLSNAEKTQSSDLSIKKKIEDARFSLEMFKAQYEDIGNSTTAQKVTAAIDVLDNALKGVDVNVGGGTLAKQWDEISSAINNAKRAISEYNAESKSKKTTSGILEDVKNAETYVKNLKATYASIGDGAAAQNLKRVIGELQTALDGVDQTATGNKLSAQWEAVAVKIAEAKRVVSEYKIEQSTIDSLTGRFDKVSEKIQNTLVNIELSGIKGKGITGLSGELNKLQEDAQAVQQKLANLDPSNAEDIEYLNTKIKELERSFANLKNDANSFKDPISAQQLAINIEKAKQKVAEYADKYSAIKNRPELVQELTYLQERAKGLSTNTDLKQFNADFAKFDAKVVEANLHTKSLGDSFKTAFANFAQFFSASRLIYEVVSRFKEMINNVRELDAAMIELKKVTDETDSSYNRFLTNAKTRAVELGTTIKDLVNATADFSRLGYNLKDATKLGEIATIYANVGDDVNGIENATSSLISTMKGFGLEAESAIDIIDKFNEVGNNFAISSGEIGEALQRSASSLFSANNTIDESISLITAANTVVQDADVVGKRLADVKSGYIG